jgi:hypothetical protein
MALLVSEGTGKRKRVRMVKVDPVPFYKEARMHKLLKLAKGRKKEAMQSTSSESSDSSDVSDIEDDDIVVLGSALDFSFMLLLAIFSFVFPLVQFPSYLLVPVFCWPFWRTPL